MVDEDRRGRLVHLRPKSLFLLKSNSSLGPREIQDKKKKDFSLKSSMKQSSSVRIRTDLFSRHPVR